jgi:hypothetical protein
VGRGKEKKEGEQREKVSQRERERAERGRVCCKFALLFPMRKERC